jgi:hypothetical protein
MMRLRAMQILRFFIAFARAVKAQQDSVGKNSLSSERGSRSGTSFIGLIGLFVGERAYKVYDGAPNLRIGDLGERLVEFQAFPAA